MNVLVHDAQLNRLAVVIANFQACKEDQQARSARGGGRRCPAPNSGTTPERDENWETQSSILGWERPIAAIRPDFGRTNYSARRGAEHLCWQQLCESGDSCKCCSEDHVVGFRK